MIKIWINTLDFITFLLQNGRISKQGKLPQTCQKDCRY